MLWGSEQILQRIGRCLLLLRLRSSEEGLQRVCGCLLLRLGRSEEGLQRIIICGCRRLGLVLFLEQLEQQDDQQDFLEVQFAVEQSPQGSIVLGNFRTFETAGIFEQFAGIDRSSFRRMPCTV